MIGLVRPHAKRCLDAMRAWSPSGALSISVYLFVQVGGVMISFITIIVVARWGGAATQGVFFTYKTLADFITTILLFGLPQAYIFLINKDRVTISGVTIFTYMYSAISVLIAFGAILLHLSSSISVNPGALAIAALSVGVGGYVLHGLARGIILTRAAAGLFSVFSVVPAVLLLSGIVFQFANGSPNFPLAIGTTGLLSGLVGVACLSRMSKLRLSDLVGIPYRALVTQSLHTFIQSSLYAAQPVLTVAMFRGRSGTDVDIGNFSIAVTAFSAINVVVSVMGPVLFNRWTKSMSWDQYSTLARRTYWVSGTLMVIAGIVLLVAEPVVDVILGPAYREAVLPIQLMTFAVFPLLSTRFLSSAIYALGHPSVNSFSCLARLVTVAACFFASYSLTDNMLASGAIAWVAGEWIAFAVQTQGASRARQAAFLFSN